MPEYMHFKFLNITLTRSGGKKKADRKPVSLKQFESI